MRTINSRVDHYVTNPRRAFGSLIAYGVSTWDMPDGPRLRREMSRSTILDSVKAMQRWARKYKIDITREIAAWHALEAELAAERRQLETPQP